MLVVRLSIWHLQKSCSFREFSTQVTYFIFHIKLWQAHPLWPPATIRALLQNCPVTTLRMLLLGNGCPRVQNRSAVYEVFHHREVKQVLTQTQECALCPRTKGMWEGGGTTLRVKSNCSTLSDAQGSQCEIYDPELLQGGSCGFTGIRTTLGLWPWSQHSLTALHTV